MLNTATTDRNVHGRFIDMTTAETALHKAVKEYVTTTRASGNWGLMYHSGRGGEVSEREGGWRTISRKVAKWRFRKAEAEILPCTDDEGINFQFCGALVNYDMTWNPMRIEQRIERIDRLGQEHAIVRTVNLHYEDTVGSHVPLNFIGSR